MQFINLAVLGRVYHEGLRRYGNSWPWADARVHHLSQADRHWMQSELASLRLSQGFTDSLQVDGLLLSFLARVARSGSKPEGPVWMGRLLAALEDADMLAGGVSTLADFVGCSREHLGRVVRARWACSSQELINRSRCEVAGRLLAAGGEDLSAVASAAGFGNLANFHRQFRRHLGTTPSRYRERQQQTFV